MARMGKSLLKTSECPYFIQWSLLFSYQGWQKALSFPRCPLALKRSIILSCLLAGTPQSVARPIWMMIPQGFPCCQNSKLAHPDIGRLESTCMGISAELGLTWVFLESSMHMTHYFPSQWKIHIITIRVPRHSCQVPKPAEWQAWDAFNPLCAAAVSFQPAALIHFQQEQSPSGGSNPAVFLLASLLPCTVSK